MPARPIPPEARANPPIGLPPPLRTRTRTRTATSFWREGSMALWLGVVVLLLGAGAWTANHYLRGDDVRVDRPKPMWIGLEPMDLQLADGKMLSIELDLQMEPGSDEDALDDYKPALSSLIEKQGYSKRRSDFDARDGITRFGEQIETAINDYLGDHGAEHRVQSVMFTQFVMLP